MMPSKSAGAEHFLFAIQDLTQQTSPLLCVFNECMVQSSLGNFEKYHIAAKFYPPFLLAKTCSFSNKMSLSQ